MTKTTALPRSHFKHWHEIQTRWNDNDQFGHINNAVYFQYFDLIVNVWMTNTFNHRHFTADFRALVVETKCTYFSETAYPEPLDLGLVCTKIGSSSIIYEIGIFRKNADICSALGQFIQVVVDTKTKMPIKIPEEFRIALDNIKPSC